MRRIAHIVNPVAVTPASDLYVAQPITFASMLAAQTYAKGQVDVRLLTTQYPEDRKMVPKGFKKTRNLKRSVLDLGAFEKKRKLPLLADILQRLYSASRGAEYCIYTNVDIGLQPQFYVRVNALIDQGFDAFSITRRTVSDEYTNVEDLEKIYAMQGESHPGQDCFVFSRKAMKRYQLNAACVGARYIGKALLLNSWCFAKKFGFFKDEHLTFHIGNDRGWSQSTYDDYWLHNAREASRIVRRLKNDLPENPDPEMLQMFKQLRRRTRRIRDCHVGNLVDLRGDEQDATQEFDT